MNNRQENCSTVEYLDEDKGALAPIDYTDIAYDKWNIEMSLRVKGVREEYWDCFLRLRTGPDEGKFNNMESRYLTLLYRDCKSVSLHEKYDNVLIRFYTGYLREIVEECDVNVDVSYYLIRRLGVFGSWYISGLLYDYRTFLLDGDGYFWYSD